MFIFDRERQSQGQRVSGEGAEREGDTESEAGSRLWAVGTEPDLRLELMNLEIMSNLSWSQMLNQLSPQVPQVYDILESNLQIGC